MNLLNPPEVADGGFWYAVAAVPDPDIGGRTPGEISGAGWCVWYKEIAGVVYSAVRTPEPITGITTVDISVADILPAGGKPRSRVGGV